MSQRLKLQWRRIQELLAQGEFSAAFEALCVFNDELLDTEAVPPDEYDSIISALSIWKALEEHHAIAA